MVIHTWSQQREIEDMINKEQVWTERTDCLVCQDSQEEISSVELSLKKEHSAQEHWRLTSEEGMEGTGKMAEMVEKVKKVKKHWESN